MKKKNLKFKKIVCLVELEERKKRKLYIKNELSIFFRKK